MKWNAVSFVELTVFERLLLSANSTHSCHNCCLSMKTVKLSFSTLSTQISVYRCERPSTLCWCLCHYSVNIWILAFIYDILFLLPVGLSHCIMDRALCSVMKNSPTAKPTHTHTQRGPWWPIRPPQSGQPNTALLSSSCSLRCCLKLTMLDYYLLFHGLFWILG